MIPYFLLKCKALLTKRKGVRYNKLIRGEMRGEVFKSKIKAFIYNEISP